LTKQDSKIVKGSLSDIAAAKNIPLAEAILDVDYVALVDISYSMDELAGREGTASRWEQMVAALNNLQIQNPGKWLVVEFSTNVAPRPNGEPSKPNGSTNLSYGLDFVLPFDGFAQIFIISDGEPDNPEAALTAAMKFRSKLNVIAVGNAAGSEFLKTLAAATGGITIPIKEAQARLITDGIKLLMEAPNA